MKPFQSFLTILLLSALALQGTQADPSDPTPTPAAPKPLSKKAVVLDVPFEKQDDPKACGLAVLKMLAAYYGQKLNQPQMDWMKTNSTAGEGVMASELLIVLGAAGFETALFQGTLDDKTTSVYHHLDLKRPLIIMITAKDGKSSHYDILNGYDPQDHLLILMDPASGPVTVAESDFQGAWERANHLTLLGVPKKSLEKTPTPTSK